jgi:deoxycytidine triphosphate deaminase
VKLLSDEALVSYVTGANPLVQGLEQPKDWYAQNSPVQPCSIDVRIGEISIPASNASRPVRSETEYILKPGETAVVTTLESLWLPSNIAAIGFSPSRDYKPSHIRLCHRDY